MRKRSIKRKLTDLSKDGIEFIQLYFSDMQGNNRAKTVTVETLRGGSSGIDGSSAFGKIVPTRESRLLLVPDLDKFSKIPWVDDEARAICDVYEKGDQGVGYGKRFEGCPRGILQKVEDSMADVLEARVKKLYKGAKIKKYHAHMSPELEFILLPKSYDLSKLNSDRSITNKHYNVPINSAEPESKILKQVLKSIGAMGFLKEQFHTEVASCQFEVGISYGNAKEIADALMTTKMAIQEIALHEGYQASFIPKFKTDVNGSGLHVHQNLAVTLVYPNGREKHVNLMVDPKNEFGLSVFGQQYVAGLLKYAKEFTPLTNPLPISFKRLIDGYEAPTRVYSGPDDREALVRLFKEGKKTRIEYRAPDPTCNPYLAFAAMLSAGLEGIQQELKMPAPFSEGCNRNDYDKLPSRLESALEHMDKSKMLRSRMGDFIIDSIYKLGTIECQEYWKEVSSIDIRRYLGINRTIQPVGN